MTMTDFSRPPLTSENASGESEVDLERATWNEALHPRQGGKFAKKGAGTTKAAPDRSGSEGLSYNGRTGAGYGKKGGDNRVHALQAELNRLGLTDGAGNKLKLDGKLGPRTTAAIKKAQRALGLKADGIATPALLAKLKSTKGLKVRKATSGSVRKTSPRTKRPTKKAPAKRPVTKAAKQAGSHGQTKSHLSGANKNAYVGN
jgi:peptidoglycan hydrolase-like protein with peptidoglycan-binding domain